MQMVLRKLDFMDINKLFGKFRQKLFTENKIPLNMRDTLPVIADDLGVVWVHTIGVSQRCAVNKNTKRAYSKKLSG